jgi:hypothetical protein
MSLDRKYRSLVVPDALTTDAITDVSDEYRRLVEMYGESTGRLTDLRQSKRDAESADRRAYASALSDGKDDPGTPRTDAATAAIADEERKVSALEVAVRDAYAAVVEAVNDERDALLARAERLLDAQRSQYRDALDSFEHAHRALAETTSLRLWLRRFPDGQPVKAAGQLVNVPGTEGRNGSDKPVTFILDALRTLAEERPKSNGKATLIEDVDEFAPRPTPIANWRSAGI